MNVAAQGISGENPPGLTVGGSSPILRSLPTNTTREIKPSPVAWEIKQPAVSAGELRGWVNSQVQPVLQVPA